MAKQTKEAIIFGNGLCLSENEGSCSFDLMPFVRANLISMSECEEVDGLMSKCDVRDRVHGNVCVCLCVSRVCICTAAKQATFFVEPVHQHGGQKTVDEHVPIGPAFGSNGMEAFVGCRCFVQKGNMEQDLED